MEHLSWRAMHVDDLPGVVAVAETVHPAFPERPDVFAERLALFPAGCHVLVDGHAVVGYAVSHPWYAARPVPLDTLLVHLPAREETRYLHDLALLPEARGAGQATRGATRIVRDAYRAGVPSLSLVAVGGSRPFWERQGFAAAADPTTAGMLAAYGDDACWMVRDLSS